MDDQEVEDDGAVKLGNAGIGRLSEDEVKGPTRGEMEMSVFCLEESFAKAYLFESNSFLEDDMLESEFISRRCSNMMLPQLSFYDQW